MKVDQSLAGGSCQGQRSHSRMWPRRSSVCQRRPDSSSATCIKCRYSCSGGMRWAVPAPAVQICNMPAWTCASKARIWLQKYASAPWRRSTVPEAPAGLALDHALVVARVTIDRPDWMMTEYQLVAGVALLAQDVIDPGDVDRALATGVLRWSVSTKTSSRSPRRTK